MQKANLGKFILFLVDTIVKLNFVAQIEALRNLLQDLPRLKKKVPLIGLFLGLLVGGLVITWGLLMIISVFALHELWLSWLHAMISMFFINLLLVGFALKGLTHHIKSFKPEVVL